MRAELHTFEKQQVTYTKVTQQIEFELNQQEVFLSDFTNLKDAGVGSLK